MDDKFERWPLLSLNGREGAEQIDDYVARGGYAGARRALAGLSPADVAAAVERAGLRGRGGGGFPVARKWHLVRQTERDVRYLVANAYDADPEAPIARALLERNPHTVLEGIAIAAYAVGAQDAYVYCRGDSALARSRLRAAIAEAEERGFLGYGAFEGRWPLIVRIVAGWGGFSGGEETVALEAIEGKRAMPRQKPPYPTEVGLWGCPTVVHSVETLANLPTILRAGPEAFAAAGGGGDGGTWSRPSDSECCDHTKVIALGGDLARPGLVEVPLGMTLGEIVLGLGGGVTEDRSLRAVQVGGPTGAVLPVDLLDTPFDHDSLAAVGAFVGSGGVRALAADVCAVDFARARLSYLAQESCGKCVPCRLGISRMAITLEGIVSGLGRPDDVALLEELAALVADGSLCGFGITAPAVLRSTLAHFGEDYRVHVEEGRCPTGRCRPLRTRRFERKTAV